MAAPRAEPSLRARALRYLAQREHSRAELRRKLARHEPDAAAVESLLDALEAADLLSAARFTESLVHRRQARYGNLRIAQELATHGVDPEAVASHLDALQATELARARAAWARRFGVLPKDAAERARQSRFLSGRGFSAAAIRAVLRGAEDEDV